MPIHSDMVWDPLRKKSVRLTPEEEVRQWFISVLHAGMKVPEHMMGSEVALTWNGMDYRADIVVYDRSAHPLLVVECKRPDVPLTAEVATQIVRYNQVLDVPYVVATNGQNTYICRRNAGGFQFLDEAPDYHQMLEYYERYHHGGVSGQ